MSLNAALSIAGGGLANINAQLSLVSNNVANASTPDYSVEIPNQEDLTAGSQPMGVMTEAATRSVNLAMQQAAFQQDSLVSGLTTSSTNLQAVTTLLGSPGQGNDLGSLLGKVSDAFTTLLNDPSQAAQQSAVVTAAGNLTGAINAISNAYTQQRQYAQNDIVSAVSDMNSDLNQIGVLNTQIIQARVSGLSTADLENQRDAAVHALSQLVSIKTLNQPNGDLIITTATGTQLPTPVSGSPVQTTGATIGSGGTYANGAIPGITLGGFDITNQLQGGRIGTDIALRDAVLPTFQGELDEFSQSLASRFAAQGLTLFSDPNGNVPAGGGSPVQSGYVGFASEIQVNPAVIANPSLVRDGTQDIAGSPTGAAAFTTNPAGGPAGFNTLINNILDYALGADAQSGIAQPAINTTGLGPDGSLSASYAAPATLAENAAALVSAQSSAAADASNQLTTEQAVQTNLNNNLATASGVNMDTEMGLMIQLENAYGANARIFSTAQAMFTDLQQIVT